MEKKVSSKIWTQPLQNLDPEKPSEKPGASKTWETTGCKKRLEDYIV